MAHLHHVVAQKFEHSGKALTNHRRAQMAHMHLFGNVWAGVVDDDFLGWLYFGNAEAIALMHGFELLLKVGGFEREIDKAWSGNRWRLAKI